MFTHNISIGAWSAFSSLFFIVRWEKKKTFFQQWYKIDRSFQMLFWWQSNDQCHVNDYDISYTFNTQFVRVYTSLLFSMFVERRYDKLFLFKSDMPFARQIHERICKSMWENVWIIWENRRKNVRDQKNKKSWPTLPTIKKTA